MNLFLAPHNDDETLFGTFTLLREKPLVVIVTDSWLQFNRGENITAVQRRQETREAMKILGCSVVFLGIPDDEAHDDEMVGGFLLDLQLNFETVYAPAIQGGNLHHDIIGKLGDEIWKDKCKHYTTYTPTELYTTGSQEVVPNSVEPTLKAQAMACYKSQIRINKPHFDAVEGKSEWFI